MASRTRGRKKKSRRLVRSLAARRVDLRSRERVIAQSIAGTRPALVRLQQDIRTVKDVADILVELRVIGLYAFDVGAPHDIVFKAEILGIAEPAAIVVVGKGVVVDIVAPSKRGFNTVGNAV